MENSNEKANAQGSDLSGLKNMFSDYHKKSQNQPSRRKSREEILAKYFVPRNTKEIFRILPPKPGKKHIEEAFFHVVDIKTIGGKIKHGTIIYCPAHNDPKVKKLDANGNPIIENGVPKLVPAPCPLCAKANEILKKQNPAINGNLKKEEVDRLSPAQKEIYEQNKKYFMESNSWQAKKFYIVRGIDKGASKDNVKFWRFKHNFVKDGVLDKLLPVLEQYMSTEQADFSDPVNGTDLTIIMTDGTFPGSSRTYKKVSAIIANGKSPLHSDSIIVRGWLDDDSTWRDVYTPKTAPGITPYQYLEMVTTCTNPYWDDSDQLNKHWVFPGRPDLELAANTRKRNLNSDNDENFEQASDLFDVEYPPVTISNITSENVGTFVDNAVDMGKSVLGQTSAEPETETESSESEEKDEYSDLPF